MKKLHLICNAHIDPIWQWTWDEGIASAIATFKSAADLADEFDYIFCHNESLLYEAIEKNAPVLFARIQKLVRQGKWHIMGGWYLQPDCLLTGGETLVRHIGRGRRYFREKFGAEPSVTTNFDSFGHSVGLVQILAKSGYTGYMTCRPNGQFQFDYPSRFFRWKGPDGSSVVATYSASYNSALGAAAEKIARETGGAGVGMLGSEKAQAGGTEDVDYLLWGVGNHGGGPSRKDLKDIAALKISGTELVHSTPEALFADGIKVKGEVSGSLVTCMPGCYSSMARVKQSFRKTENLFYATEKLLSAAMMAGYRAELSELQKAEQRLLLASFHDILPGSCVEEGEREGLGLLADCEKIAKDYRTNAFLYFVMGQKPAKEGEFPVFVFNYMPCAVHTAVEAEFSLADQNWSEDTVFVPHVYTESGEELACQQVKEDSTIALDWRKRIVFAADLQPLGITRFSVRVSAEKKSESAAKAVSLGEALGNAPVLGAPVSLELYEDTADPWGMSEEELRSLGKNPVPFREMSERESRDFCAVGKDIPPVREIENGPVCRVIEGLYTAGRSNAAVQYKLYAELPFVDLKVTVEFADKNKLVRLKIPVPAEFAGGCAVGDGPFVWEQKPKGENAFQKWYGMQGSGGRIFAVINDGVYAGKAENGYLYLTLVRGAGYCMHPIPGRGLYPQDRYLPRIDGGRYVYEIRLFTGSAAEVCRQAELFGQRPYAVNVFPAGNAAADTSPQIVLDGEVILAAAKPCVSGKYLLRIYNPADSRAEFTLRAGGNTLCDTAAPREVVTVLCGRNGLQSDHRDLHIYEE